MADHEIAFSDAGATGVIQDLRTILDLINQIKAAGGFAGGGIGGSGALPGRAGSGSSLIPGLATGIAAPAWGSPGTRRMLPGTRALALPQTSLRESLEKFKNLRIPGSVSVVEGNRRLTYDPSLPPRWEGNDFNPGTGGGEGLGRRGWSGEGGPFKGRMLKSGPSWWQYAGVGSVSPGLARMGRRFSKRVLPALNRAVRPLAYLYVGEQIYNAVDGVPEFAGEHLELGAGNGFKIRPPEDQRGINRALSRVPEARREALKDLQWTISASTEQGFRLERHKSFWPWNWKTTLKQDSDKTRAITEEVILREKYFKTAWMAESVGEKAYLQTDPLKYVAQQSALIATGRIYKSPYPHSLNARTRSGG